MLVVDSSVLVAHLRGHGEATAFLSRERSRGHLVAPTLVAWELWRGATTPTREERVEALLASVVADPFTAAVARLAGEVDLAQRRAGRQAPLYDTLIASHALFHDAPLSTMDRDYSGIEALDVIEVPAR